MDWFEFRAGNATAFGRETNAGFIVRKGSTAVAEGTAKVKRDAKQRRELVGLGVLKPKSPDLLEFTSDYEFNSPSAAGGVIKDGNCSGPQAWRHTKTGETLKDWRKR